MDTPPEHYFTAEPAGVGERVSVSFPLDGTTVTAASAPGVFSHGRLDLGTSVLLRRAPGPPPRGDLLDLGCGWGPIALSLAARAPLARVWGVDVNRRAVALLAENAASLGLTGVVAGEPDQVPGDQMFDGIWSNPPIRVGKAALHELLLSWLPRLRPGASAYLVAQRHLGADSLQTWLAGNLGPEFTVTRVASAKGYRVLAARRSGGAAPSPA
jgi:16S rRNA G1207 methylase RsmC